MATYQREPLVNSDLNIWGNKELAQNRINQGNNTCKLFVDSGVLKISVGRIGINTGSSYGVVNVTAEEIISLVAIPSGNWAQIEALIVGTNVSFVATEIVGATNANTIPTAFTDLYNDSRSGYYTGASRILGIAWVNSGGTLTNVVNTNPNIEGYNGSYEAGTTALLYGSVLKKSKMITITDNYTITSDDMQSEKLTILFTKQASNKTLTLLAASLNPGIEINIKVAGAAAGTLALAGPDTINGIAPASWVFEGVGGLLFFSNGSTYEIRKTHIWDIGSSRTFEKYTNKKLVQRGWVDRDGIAQNGAFLNFFRTTNYNETFPLNFNDAAKIVLFLSACDKDSIAYQTIYLRGCPTVSSTGSYYAVTSTTSASRNLRFAYEATEAWA